MVEQWHISDWVSESTAEVTDGLGGASPPLGRCDVP